MSAEVELSKRGDDGLTTRLVALVVTVAVLVTGAIAFRRHDPASVATALAPQAVSSADVLRGQDLVYSCWIELEAQRDLCLVAGDGSGDINLTNTPDISEVWPAWSSDGTRLAFVREQNSGEMNIWQPRTGGIAIADVPPTDELFAGATIDIRSTSFPGFMPSWKPSSSSAPFDKILYSRHTDVNDIHNRSEIELHIAIVEPDGSIRDQGRLANMGGQHVDGTWRDAYSVLATYRKGSASGGSFAAVSDVFEMDPIPGKENRKELTHAFASVEGALEADLSADGRRMTFIRCGNVITLSAQCAFDARRLVVADPDGSSESTVFDDRSGPRNPRWSPDGTLIAYSNKAGVKVYALDTNVDIVVPGSDLYDVTPSWRPRDVGDLGVVAVDESGRPNSLFDEGENVHARVNPLSGASSLRVCLLPAVSVVPEPMPGTGYCEPDPVAAARGEVRSPTLTVHDILPDPVPSRVTIDMFTPSATRWQIGADHLDAFGNLMLREVSRPFGVTCVGGSCAVFPYLGTAARYRGYADLIDAFNTLISVTCFSIELVLLGMTALSAGFSGSLAGLGISMVAGFAIQQIVGEVLGNLASSVMGSALSRVVGDTFEEGILDSRTTQSESAWANYEYLQLDPTASPEVQELVVDAVNDADEQLDTADKRLRRVGIFGTVCSLIQTSLTLVATTFNLLAGRLEAMAPNTVGAGGGSSSIALMGTPAPAASPAPAAPRQFPSQDDPPAPDVPAMPADMAASGQSLVLLQDQLDLLSSDADAVGQGGLDTLDDESSALAARMSSLAVTFESFDAVGDFMATGAAAANRADAPIFSAEEAAGLAALQQRVANDGLYGFETLALSNTGMTPEEIDAYLEDLASVEVPPAVLTTTPNQLAEMLDDAADDLAEETRSLAMSGLTLASSVSGAPMVDDLHVTTAVDTGVTMLVPAFDRDGDDLDVEVVSGPTHGELLILGPEFVYVPDPGFTGPDSFTWHASDAAATSPDAIVTIKVLQAPPAPEPDEFGVRQGTTLSVPAPGVLGNDLSSWIPLSATLVRPPLGATVALRSDGGFTFTPFPETVGPVTFTYRTQFEGSAPSDPVTVTIDVVDAADPPEAHPDVVTTPEGASVVVAPLANDVDPDGDPVTLVGYEQGALGKVSCNLAASCTYTPTPDATGEDSWRYTVTDGTGRRSRGTVRVTITPVDEPPAPADDVLRFVKGVNGALDLLANDADPDGGPLTFVGISDQPDSGSLVCDAVGVCTYTPANATVSGDEATYVVRDDDGVEASATVAIRAFAAFEEIESPGPILFIQGGSTLGCGAEYTGDDLGSFFAEFACGTFLASGGALYGPANIPGDGTNQPQPRTTFTPLRQSFVEGDGSPDDPFRITTTVAAGASGLELTQVDTYVTGATSYRTDLTVTNIGGGPANATLWRAGDCQRADSDTGFGRLDPTTGAVACVGADGRALEWFPLSAGSAAFEGDPIDMWEVIATRAAFPNTCRCADDIDNAAGLSWTVALAPGESTTRSHLTVFAPSGAAPISLGIAADESEVGPGASNGFTLTATNTDAISDSSLSQLRAVLPPGFSYVPGTTTGLGEPTVDGGVVQWNGPLVIGSSGSLVVHIGVIASDAAGIHTAKVDGTSADAAVAVGPGADVTVSEGALPPLPLFGATPTLLAVDFDAADSLDDGEIVAFAWAYGDGASGSGETSAHSYAAPGTYDVTLTVTDDDGYVRSTTKPVTVSDPNAGPTAIGTFMPARPVTAPAGAGPAFVAAALEPDFTGLSIVFDGTQSFDDDGSIIGWAWDFGDGSSGSGAVIEHEFPGPGHYIVRLTVTDDEGASATATIPVDVTVPPNVPPTADFEYVVDALSVDFDGTASVDPDAIDGQPVEWDWDFGDGTTGSGSQPTHAYATDGTYDVTLTVTDADGATDSITRTVGVGDEANEPPTAVIGTDVDGLTVDFEGIDSTDTDGTVEGYEWNFGDPDSTATGDTTSHIFPAPGTYTVFLMVTDDDGAVGTASMEVTVDEPEDTTTTSTSTSTSTTTTSSTTTTTTIDPDSTSSTTTSTSTSTTSTSSTTTSTSSTTTSTTSPTTTSTTSSTTSTTLAPTTSSSTTLAPTTSSSTTSTTATPSVVTFGPTTSVGEVGAPTSTPPPTISGGLPKTGSNSGRSLELVLLLLAAGLGLVLVSRRPKRS